MDLKERDGTRVSGQTPVKRGKILGTIPIGTAKRIVLSWIRGRLLNLFFISVQSVLKSSCEDFPKPKRISRETQRILLI